MFTLTRCDLFQLCLPAFCYADRLCAPIGMVRNGAQTDTDGLEGGDFDLEMLDMDEADRLQTSNYDWFQPASLTFDELGIETERSIESDRNALELSDGVYPAGQDPSLPDVQGGSRPEVEERDDHGPIQEDGNDIEFDGEVPTDLPHKPNFSKFYATVPDIVCEESAGGASKPPPKKRRRLQGKQHEKFGIPCVPRKHLSQLVAEQTGLTAMSVRILRWMGFPIALFNVIFYLHTVGFAFNEAATPFSCVEMFSGAARTSKQFSELRGK